jgi:hypothetical protein
MSDYTGPYGLADGVAKGHNTYLHAGSSKGWPADHTVEDTFDIPVATIKPERGPLVAAFDQPHYDWVEDSLPPRSSEAGYFFPDAITAEEARKALYDSPVFTPEAQAALPRTVSDDSEYVAVWGGKGNALLVCRRTLVRRTITDTTIANFDTMADARTAAEALNNHKGY